MDKAFIKQAEAALTAADPLLGSIIARAPLVDSARGNSGYFADLCRSIIGQQVSVAAARAIARRFEATTGLQPAVVAGLNEDQARAIGLSRQKAGYLRDLGAHFAADPAIYDHLDRLSDDEVTAKLTRVKGIGVWTAQMFLMFTLQRPDVFAPDDVGLQKAAIQLYGWGALPPKAEFAHFAERWAPYRTIASLHLWQSLDNAPAVTTPTS